MKTNNTVWSRWMPWYQELERQVPRTKTVDGLESEHERFLHHRDARLEEAWTEPDAGIAGTGHRPPWPAVGPGSGRQWIIQKSGHRPKEMDGKITSISFNVKNSTPMQIWFTPAFPRKCKYRRRPGRPRTAAGINAGDSATRTMILRRLPEPLFRANLNFDSPLRTFQGSFIPTDILDRFLR